MCGMILRLDPRRPLVWRTPHSMQIGIDPVIATLEHVDDRDAHLIAALSAGITRSGLAVIAERAAVAPQRVDALLAELAACLVIAPTPEPMVSRGRIAVVGTVPAAAKVAGLLAESGHPVITTARSDGMRTRGIAAAVLVSHHVIDPIEHLSWLRRDIPHLPVVIGERAATVGPLVEPGATACLACVEQQRTDADAAWPAIGSQLWGRITQTDAPLLATEAAIEVVRVLQRLGDRGAAAEAARHLTAQPAVAQHGAAQTSTAPNVIALPRPALSVRIDADSGAHSPIWWSPSSRCGCGGLALSAAATVAG